MNPIPVPDAAKATRPYCRLVAMGPPPGVSDDECGTPEMLISPVADNPIIGPAQYAYFRPTPSECAQLARGGFLEMAQHGTVVQPFSLVVWPPTHPGCPPEACEAAHGPYRAEFDPLVQAERIRQIAEKGYTPSHDDGHTLREVAACADQRLADLIGTYGEELYPELTARLVEVRAVLLAVVESAERRMALAAEENAMLREGWQQDNATLSAEVERLRALAPASGVIGEYERLTDVRVVDLRPGDVVRLSGGPSGIFISSVRHPVHPTLQLVVWRLEDGTWSHDALDARQVVGDRDDVDDDERGRRLRASFGRWEGVPW